MFVSVTAMSLTLKSSAATSARSMTGSDIRIACPRPGQAAIPVFGHVARSRSSRTFPISVSLSVIVLPRSGQPVDTPAAVSTRDESRDRWDAAHRSQAVMKEHGRRVERGSTAAESYGPLEEIARTCHLPEDETLLLLYQLLECRRGARLSRTRLGRARRDRRRALRARAAPRRFAST